MQHFVLTIYGDAHVGVFEDIAKLSRERGAEWQTSKVSRIGNHVTLLIKGCIASADYETLQTALNESFKGLHFIFADVDASYVDVETALTCTFSCLDRAGLSRELSTALTASCASVTSLDIQRYPVIGGAAPVFSAEMKLVLSEGCNEELVQQALSDLAENARISFSSNTQK